MRGVAINNCCVNGVQYVRCDDLALPAHLHNSDRVSGVLTRGREDVEGEKSGDATIDSEWDGGEDDCIPAPSA